MLQFLLLRLLLSQPLLSYCSCRCYFCLADPIIAVVAAVALENHFSFQMLIDVQCDVILKMVSLTGRLEQSPTEAMDKSR